MKIKTLALGIPVTFGGHVYTTISSKDAKVDIWMQDGLIHVQAQNANHSGEKPYICLALTNVPYFVPAEAPRGPEVKK